MSTSSTPSRPEGWPDWLCECVSETDFRAALYGERLCVWRGGAKVWHDLRLGWADLLTIESTVPVKFYRHDQPAWEGLAEARRLPLQDFVHWVQSSIAAAGDSPAASATKRAKTTGKLAAEEFDPAHYWGYASYIWWRDLPAPLLSVIFQRLSFVTKVHSGVAPLAPPPMVITTSMAAISLHSTTAPNAGWWPHPMRLKCKPPEFRGRNLPYMPSPRSKSYAARIPKPCLRCTCNRGI
ncbi:uncharacterized protein MONBRDRAFT_24439 [Monosiga brevicollis MX1]|uniref:Uncharacterized protein n=1 Tax=Monosiga brevicollis TaxID=81824 RepID=A9UWF1_MONBE|nr:uncharacterized protein MONBRDRAFT_24439 [Monosiga brevicollis MX1]EDQ90554.1 predicted protein [Monosiga brevicollis MX1]|eukprot:XP_001744605.1 hypothetical protein [Monosiga brevicollis MX1]